jgi:hypothetical protein
MITATSIPEVRNCSAEMACVWAEELWRSSSDRAVRRKSVVFAADAVSYGF